MLKEIHAPHLNRNVKLGRKPRAPGGMRIHLSDFIQHAKLPAIPTSCNFAPAAAGVLADIYGNDALGDCVIAAGYHLEAVATGNAIGKPYHATSSQIVKDYSAIGGYVPGNPNTDQGCNETEAFAYWRSHGFANGTKLLGAISVNCASKADVMAACFLFENLFFGIGLPDPWISPFPSGNGFTWGLAGHSDPSNGHAFNGVGFNASGVQIDTWGLIGTVTWEAIAAYAGPSGGGELYAVLTPDQLAKGQAKAPNGIAWSDLVAAFDSMGGDVPVPPPSPTVGPSVLQAQTWANAGIRTLYKPGMTLKQAEAAASAGLATNWPH